MNPSNARTAWLGAASLAFAVSFGAFLRAAPEGLYFGDTGELALDAWGLDIMHSPGSALFPLFAHPFRLLPAGDMAFQGAVYSAAAAAFLTAGLVWACGFLAGHWRGEADRVFSEPLKILLASGCVMGLAFSESWWKQGSIADIYTTYTLFFSIYLLFMTVWTLRPETTPRLFLLLPWLIVFEVGLYLGMGHFTALFIAFAATAKKWRLPDWPKALMAIALGMIASGALAYYPLRSAADPAIDWGNPETLGQYVSAIAETIQMAPGRDASRAAGNFHLMAGRIAEQFPYGAFYLSCLGFLPLWKISKRLFTAALLTDALVIYALLFSFTSSSADFSEVAFPFFVVHAAALFLGLMWLAGRTARYAPMKGREAAVSLGFCILAWGVAAVVGVRAWPKADRSGPSLAMEYARNAFAAVPPGGVIFAFDNVDVFPLWYAQTVHGLGRNVPVVWIPYLPVDWYAGGLAARHPGLKLADARQRRDVRGRRFASPEKKDAERRVSFDETFLPEAKPDWIPGLKRYLQGGGDLVRILSSNQPERPRLYTHYKYAVQPVAESQARAFVPTGPLYLDPAGPGIEHLSPEWSPSPGPNAGEAAIEFVFERKIQSAFAYRDAGKLEAAAEWFEEAAAILPDSAEVHAYLADVYGKSGQAGKAFQHYEAYLEDKPDDENAWLNAALLAARNGEAERAESFFKRGLSANPHSRGLALNRAVLYYQLKDETRLEGALGEALERHPDFGQAWRLSGLEKEVLGDFEDAERSFQQAFLYAPDDSNVAVDSIRNLLGQGRHREAMNRYASALSHIMERCVPAGPETCLNALAPLAALRNLGEANVLFNIAAFYAEQGRAAESQETVHLMQKLHPADPFTGRAVELVAKDVE